MKVRASSLCLLRRVQCLLLAVVVAVSPSAAVYAQTNAAQQAVRQRVQGLERPPVRSRDELEAATPTTVPQPPGTTPAARPIDGAIDTSFVSPSSAVVIVLRPAQLMNSEFAKMMPTEVATAAGFKYLGFDPATVDEVVAFGELSNMAAPGYGMTLKFNQPFKGAAIPAETRAHAQLGELNGKKYLQSQNPMMPSFYGPNNKTLVMAPDESLRQLVGSQVQPNPGSILDRVSRMPAGSDLYIAVDVAALRPMTGMWLGMAKPQADEVLQPFFDLPNLIASLELTLNLSGPGPTSLVVNANDEAAAEQILTLINDGIQKYQANLKAQLAEQANSEDPIERAWAQYADRVSGSSLTQFIPTRDGAKLTVFHSEGLDESQKKMLVMGLGVSTALLLPAQQAARQAARRNQSMNNMRQISIALQNYHDTRKTLPAHANYSDDGKPLLSWRVHILPFTENMPLYQQFHLDEPWDSEHNKALIAQMPDVYKCPDVALEPGKTNYLAAVGKDCLMDGTEKGIGFRQVTDGTSRTILFVEADPARAVEWTKPADWEMNPENPHDGLGNVRPQVWLAAFADAHIETVVDTLDPTVLKSLFTRNGGEVVNLNAPAAPMPVPVP